MKNRIVILSDIHIGDNSPTCWYQQKYHEPYLLKALDYIGQHAESIEEVVLLGDTFDFWPYPCSRRPPSFDDIVAANPGVLGPAGKLREIADRVPVTYVNGNHDMNIGRDEIAKLGRIRYHPALKYVRESPAGRILFTHGNEYTIFTAQDPATVLSPLPVEHFVTRSVAEYLTKNILSPGQTVADLAGNGTPSKATLLPHLIKALETSGSLARILLGMFSTLPGLSDDTLVRLQDGRTVTLHEAGTLYQDLGTQWTDRFGVIPTSKSVIADLLGDYAGWWAQRDSLQPEIDADIAVLGHTHIARGGLKEAMIRYINCGFMCSPLPGGNLQHPITFGEIDLANGNLSVMSCDKPGEPFSPGNFPDDSVVYAPARDFSCYVTIVNKGGSAVVNRGARDIHGYYVVPPPPAIAPSGRARFWLQDYPGLVGTAGEVTYATPDNKNAVAFTYADPLVGNNACSPVPFRNRSGNGSWETDKVVTAGHPYFVEFSAFG